MRTCELGVQGRDIRDMGFATKVIPVCHVSNGVWEEGFLFRDQGRVELSRGSGFGIGKGESFNRLHIYPRTGAIDMCIRRLRRVGTGLSGGVTLNRLVHRDRPSKPNEILNTTLLFELEHMSFCPCV